MAISWARLSARHKGKAAPEISLAGQALDEARSDLKTRKGNRGSSPVTISGASILESIIECQAQAAGVELLDIDEDEMDVAYFTIQ